MILYFAPSVYFKHIYKSNRPKTIFFQYYCVSNFLPCNFHSYPIVYGLKIFLFKRTWSHTYCSCLRLANVYNIICYTLYPTKLAFSRFIFCSVGVDIRVITHLLYTKFNFINIMCVFLTLLVFFFILKRDVIIFKSYYFTYSPILSGSCAR